MKFKIMKKSILIVLSCFFIFSNCSVNNSDSTPTQKVEYLWHLVNVTGGFSGIDEQFSVDTVVWVFNEDAKILTVENNNDDDSIEDGLDTGTYNYSVLAIDNITYLIVDDNELGSFTSDFETLTINQNIISTGSGADGFIYEFKREVVITN